jgi:iron(III) transport system ATP-binding protein
MRMLDVADVTIAYDADPVVRSVSFRLEQGAIGCLLGPSGCGKTTLLRGIAGFQPVSTGQITIAGELVSRPGHTVAPERRQVGMVFQDFALFSHLSVADNIAFGIRRWRAEQRRERVRELLSLIGLPDAGRAWPHELSGGQQQRIALARALASRPRLLLLDEPFSSLDVSLRADLAREVRRILRHEQMTAILVTHDQMEAFAIADEIGVLQHGQLMQWDSGYNLYHRPANRFIARFVGQGALIAGTVMGPNEVLTEVGTIASREPLATANGTAVDVLMRPDDLRCVEIAEADVTGVVTARDFRGAEYLYTIELDNGERVLSLAHSHERYDVGERIGLAMDTRHLIIFSEQDNGETPVF